MARMSCSRPGVNIGRRILLKPTDRQAMSDISGGGSVEAAGDYRLVSLREALCGFIENAVAPGSLIVTDDWSGYPGLGKRGFDHHAVAECGEPEVALEFLPIIQL
jgi:hypothetical protein